MLRGRCLNQVPMVVMGGAERTWDNSQCRRPEMSVWHTLAQRTVGRLTRLQRREPGRTGWGGGAGAEAEGVGQVSAEEVRDVTEGG